MAFLARAGGSIHPREWLLKSAVVALRERDFQCIDSQRFLAIFTHVADTVAGTKPRLQYFSDISPLGQYG